jgi:hypothetical protein
MEEEERVFDLYVGDARVDQGSVTLPIGTTMDLSVRPVGDEDAFSCVLDSFTYRHVTYDVQKVDEEERPKVHAGVWEARAKVWVTPKKTRITHKHTVTFYTVGQLLVTK